jgi:3-hydroxybutyryl-CoA dehydrogenase
VTVNTEFENVAVIGAGTMGAGIAQICAMAGSRVVMQDVNQELVDRGMERIRAFLAKGVQKGRVTAVEERSALERVETELDLETATGGADLVIEAIPEDLELKKSLFGRIAAHCPERTVLTSNTSSLILEEVFAGVPAQGRCCGMHFFNPPPLMPLVEVIRPRQAAADVLDRVMAYARQLRKEPILVKDSPGFATSRLGVTLGLEAIRMVEAGVAAPEDIDKAMELGYRHPMGPLRLSDLVGLDVRMAIADYLRVKLDSPVFEVPQLMRQMVDRGELGKKTGQGFYTWDD